MSGFPASLAEACLRSLLPAELSSYRGSPVPPWQPDAADAALAEAGIDSLELMHLAALVSDRFLLDETGLEDWLLRLKTPAEWAGLLSRASEHTSGVRFYTSGSTGTPRGHQQSWSRIRAEAAALAELVGERLQGAPRRVVSWLPVHHLYGFMAGLTLPWALDCAHQVVLADELLPPLQSGDVLVTIPERWNYLARTRRQWPVNVVGISSTAPLPGEVADRLRQAGLGGLMEIYGSTETSGVAVRWQHDRPYRLLPHWRQGELPHTLSSAAVPEGEAEAVCLLPDHLDWSDDGHFRLAGRRDAVVQVGGHNVAPAEIARRLEAMPGVAASAVRLQGTGSNCRLKAFIVPEAEGQEPIDALLERLRSAVTAWPAAERPVRFDSGPALPVNAMGKLRDW